MASGYQIDPDKFKGYCEETRMIYLQLYPWYNMPATLHKILVHGASGIQLFLLVKYRKKLQKPKIKKYEMSDWAMQ